MFVVEILAATALLEAWPLVHLAIPELNLADWRRNANIKPGTPRKKQRSGILVARRRARREICGIVWYRSEVDLALGRILRARHLLAIDIIDVKPVMTALLYRLGPIAQALNCATIRLAVQKECKRRTKPADALFPLKLHAVQEHWLDVSFATDLLCRNDEKTNSKTDNPSGPG